MVVDSSGLSATAANIAGAIRRAAQATGASFDYLLAAAKVESNLNPGVQARTSSATGLFQFIDQTWLSTLKLAGPALGYGRYAAAIGQTPSGSYTVTNPAMRAAVMRLRRDPAANAAMAGAFTQQNAALLQGRLGRPPTSAELYIAHFLGGDGAAKLITMAATTPHANAAAEFPVAAAANRSVFFNQQGGPRGAGEVYSLLAARLEAARLAMHAPAAAAPVRAAVPAATPDPADSFDAMTTMTGVPVAQGESSAAPFHSLFQTGGRRQAISPVVAALWGGQGQAVSAPVATSANIATPSVPPPTVQRAAPAQPPDLRGLYQNDAPNLRGLFDGTS